METGRLLDFALTELEAEERNRRNMYPTATEEQRWYLDGRVDAATLMWKNMLAATTGNWGGMDE